MSKKPTIYLLHGWSVSSENEQKWQGFISLLQEAGINAVFLKIPGLSSPLDTVWNLDDFVEWLGTQLPRDEKVTLLGHSFGGQISARFSSLYPERVSALILVDSAGIRDHAVIPTVKRSVFWFAAKFGRILLPLPVFRTLLYKLARERDYLNAPPLMKRTMSLVLDHEVVEDLPNIQCPTLIIWGKNDAVTPYKMSKQFHALIKNSRVVIISAARHSPQFTHPTETATAVTQFIDSL